MTIVKSYIAYEGPKFVVEWYFTEDGKIPALAYFNDLDDDDKIRNAQSSRSLRLMKWRLTQSFDTQQVIFFRA